MAEEKAYRFAPFRLDPANWRLRKNNEFRALRPKTFAILRHLLDNAGRLVTKDDLLRTVWPGVKVENSALRVCMNELRQVLEDDPHRPRFVETVHRLGYRFIASVDLSDEEEDEPAHFARPQPIVVGRDAEVARLLESWERALSGTQQVVFIAGEPGVGKTTLVDKFLAMPLASGFARIGRGQCADQYGNGEAYLPVFEAIATICNGRKGKDARRILLREAPDWSAQMPWLRSVDGPNNGAPARQPSQARMLRELAVALATIASARPVVLVFEDLHLSDRATAEAIAYLAKRRDPVRLMIVGTYRSAGTRRDPARLAAMARDLRDRGQCQILRLSGLKEADVADYLHRRVDRPLSPKLAAQVHRRTGGNPLFMAALVDHLESSGATARSWPDDLRELGVPDNVHAMIEHQIDELPEEDRRILKLASVAGAANFEFSSAELAAACGDESEPENQDTIEERCQDLTRRVGFLLAADVARWPDGTVSAGYLFGHALYQEVLYAMMSGGQRARAHLRIAHRLEAAYGAQAGRISTQLAMHFERGGDPFRAAENLNNDADTALSRGAPLEALAQIEKALGLLKLVPRDHDRARLELRLEATRSQGLVMGRFSRPKIEATVRRIGDLVDEVGNWAVPLLVIQGVTRRAIAPRESRAWEVLSTAALRRAESESHGAQAAELVPLQSFAHMALSTACIVQGKYHEAAFHARRAIETYNPAYQSPSSDSRVHALAEYAVAQWTLGYADEARRLMLEAIAAGEKTGNANALAFAISRAATICAFTRQPKEQLAFAERLVAFTADKDVEPWHSWGLFLRGSAREQMGEVNEGYRIMRSALAALESGDANHPPTITTHARASLRYTEVAAGLLRAHQGMRDVQEVIDECIQTGSVGLLADLYRLMGLLALLKENPDRAPEVEAEGFFRKAIAPARSQGAISLELLAALDLGRMLRRQGKTAEARRILSSILRRFAEGHDTPNLNDAQGLLDELQTGATR